MYTVLCALSFLASVSHAEIHTIVNGVPTTASDFPFIVDVRVTFNNGGFSTSVCTGSLLQLERPATVLTGAHCVDGVDEDPVLDGFAVFLSRSDADAPSGPNNNFTFHEVSSFVMHPDFDNVTFANDVALLFIDEDLSTDSRLEVVLVPDLSADEECCCEGDDLQVLGYGNDVEDGDPTDTLEYSVQKFVPRDECNALYNAWRLNGSINASIVDWVEDTMICSIGNDTDSCQGDSGGPLIKTDTRVQVGVTSWGIGCNLGLPGVSVNLGLYKSWMEQTISAAANENVTLPPIDSTTTTPPICTPSSTPFTTPVPTPFIGTPVPTPFIDTPVPTPFDTTTTSTPSDTTTTSFPDDDSTTTTFPDDDSTTTTFPDDDSTTTSFPDDDSTTTSFPDDDSTTTTIPIDTSTTMTTPFPSAIPTVQPTTVPTRQPTGDPTAMPTVQPTNVPTTQPTGDPTADPTAFPTTRQPTVQPTTPTNEPSNEPTNPPSSEPSVRPTTVPTRDPTGDPSAQPTLTTVQPTAVPTLAPTTTSTTSTTTTTTTTTSAPTTAEPTTATPTTAMPTTSTTSTSTDSSDDSDSDSDSDSDESGRAFRLLRAGRASRASARHVISAVDDGVMESTTPTMGTTIEGDLVEDVSAPNAVEVDLGRNELLSLWVLALLLTACIWGCSWWYNESKSAAMHTFS